MVELKIDPEFRDKIPPLTDAEFEQLRENILSDGEVYEPIVVWNGTIVDGHNRWKVIQEHPEIPYRTKEVEFENRWAAIAWMCKNQLGRRNLSDNDRTYLMGKRNEAEKMAIGGNRGNQYTKVAGSDLDLGKKGKTAQRIADEYGVGYGTVIRAEKFAKGVDALRDVSAEAAEKIMHGNSVVSKADVAEIAKMELEKIEEAAKAIIAGEPIRKKPERNPNIISLESKVSKKLTDEDRKQIEMIKQINERSRNYDSDTEYTIDMFLDELLLNGENYATSLKNALVIRSTLLVNENRSKVKETIETIIEKINKVKELMT